MSSNSNKTDCFLLNLGSFFTGVRQPEALYGYPAGTLIARNPLSFLTEQDSYTAVLEGWLRTSLSGSFNLWKLTNSFSNNSGYNSIVYLDFLKPTVSGFDLLLNYSLQQTSVGQLESTLTPLTYTNLANSLSMVKALNTYSNAFWKVFKSTIDEERGFFSISNYSNLDFKLPIVMQNTPSVLSSLHKNSKGVNHDLIFMQKFNKIGLVGVSKPLTTFAFEFPFNLAFESDIIRYSWFDWYSTRNLVITKAMDTSVFNLYGVRDYDYSFTRDKATAVLTRSDNFFAKYLSARKLSLPSYNYNPYFFSISTKRGLVSPELGTTQASLYSQYSQHLSRFYFLISNGTLVTGSALSGKGLIYTSSATVSGIRAYFGSLDITQNQAEAITNTLDLLSKKEYILKSINLGKLNNPRDCEFLLNANPSLNNPIVLTLKAYFNANESSIKFTTGRGCLVSPKREPFTNYSKLSGVTDFSLRSQYQPLKKGIVNMIRIQADKAIAMPTDTRLQILAVSKDIIHSWAIPSAGIKIDCIPGYSSHRVAIFTLSGVYWGQCMEICGRFHH